MIYITRHFAFEAAHQLPLHDGKCQRLHGHSYKLEVSVVGARKESGPKTGMILDFTDLDEVVREAVLDRCDHRNLNDIFYFTTTAENLVEAFAKAIYDDLGYRDNIHLRRVVLWETARNCAIWEPEVSDYVDFEGQSE